MSEYNNLRGNEDVESQMATGKMSVLFAGITLACSQIGSALVALPSMLQQTQIVYGALILAGLGLLVFAATYHLQQLWLHMRKAQLNSPEAKYVVQNPTLQIISQEEEEVPLMKFEGEGGTEEGDYEFEWPTIQYFSLLEYVANEVIGDKPWLVNFVRRWTLAMQVIALGGTAVSEVIQVGASMYIATGWMSCQFWALVLGFFLMTPLTWIPDYKKLERFSMVAVVAVIFTALTVVVVGGLVVDDEDYVRCEADEFDVPTFFVGTSGFVFIWGGLALVPEVQSSMQHPSRLTHSFAMNLVFCLIVTLSTGLVGLNLCTAEGSDGTDGFSELPANVLQNMPDSIFRNLAALSLSIHMTIAFAVLLMPLMEAFEKEFKPLQKSMPLRIASRTGWSSACVLIAVAFPFFGDIVAIVAAVAQVYLSFVAPPLMFVAIFKDELWETTWGKAQIVLCIEMAVGMIVFGTGFGMYAGVYDLKQNISTWGIFEKNWV